MFPIYTDDITDNIPVISEMFGAKLKEGANDYEPQYSRVVRSGILDSLKANRILQNRMQKLFASVQSITGNKELYLIYACLLTSYADAAGRGTQLCLSMKECNDIPQDIKDAVFKHFDYEEE